MKTSVKTIAISGAVTVALLVPSFLNTVHADDVMVPSIISSSNTSSVVTEGNASFNNVMNKIADNVDANAGTQTINLVNPTEVVNEISQADIDNINALSRQEGIDITYTKQSLVQLFDNQITNLNAQVQDGSLMVESNGSVVNNNDSNFYVQGGSTYDVVYWWGKRRYKSTSAANDWVHTLNNVAAGNAAASAIFGKISLENVAVGNILASSYCWKAGGDIAYVNSKSNRGIIADVTWILTYSIKTQ